MLWLKKRKAGEPLTSIRRRKVVSQAKPQLVTPTLTTCCLGYLAATVKKRVTYLGLINLDLIDSL